MVSPFSLDEGLGPRDQHGVEPYGPSLLPEASQELKGSLKGRENPTAYGGSKT